MRPWLSATLFALLLLGGLVALYFWHKPSNKPRIRPPPRSRKPDESYQAVNSLARLFLEAVALKEERAKWPGVLKTLNPEDEPRIRTLLLELRQPDAVDPRTALQAIEQTCIQAQSESRSFSRAEPSWSEPSQ